MLNSCKLSCISIAALIVLSAWLLADPRASAQTTPSATVTAITQQLLICRDKLNADKTRLYVLRQRLVQRLTEWDIVLRQVESSLRWNPPSKSYLLEQRSRAMAEIAAAERTRNDLDYTLRRINDDLRRIDDELARFTVLKASTY
jgi:hypothetical protein